MPKLKTHKGMKKRFKVSANGKVSHKRCGSSHLMSHKSGKQVRRLRKKSTLKVTAEAHRIRFALLDRQNVNPEDVQAQKMAALRPRRPSHAASHGRPGRVAILNGITGRRNRCRASTEEPARDSFDEPDRSSTIADGADGAPLREN